MNPFLVHNGGIHTITTSVVTPQFLTNFCLVRIKDDNNDVFQTFLKYKAKHCRAPRLSKWKGNWLSQPCFGCIILSSLSFDWNTGVWRWNLGTTGPQQLKQSGWPESKPTVHACNISQYASATFWMFKVHCLWGASASLYSSSVGGAPNSSNYI